VTFNAMMSMPYSQWYPLKRCLIKYELDSYVFVYLNCSLFAGSLQKWLAHFLLIRNDGNDQHISSQKNDGIFNIFDKIKVSRVLSCKSGIAIFTLRVLETENLTWSLIWKLKLCMRTKLFCNESKLGTINVRKGTE